MHVKAGKNNFSRIGEKVVDTPNDKEYKLRILRAVVKIPLFTTTSQVKYFDCPGWD